MPPTVKPLDGNLAYVYCPRCKMAGSPNVPMKRNLGSATAEFVCVLGAHEFRSWDQLQSLNAEMTPMSAVLQETPNPLAVKWTVWVMPKTREVLEQRLQGRIITTIATMLDALADSALIFIEGAEAKELKKMGISNGAQIISALKGVKDAEKQRDEALNRLARFTEMLRDAGVEE